ncbi:MAG TPA: uracil phosphoribosyltransferase [Bacteroidales bacterium]|nr:uracil phosphoribosyltransferase [Bacteroidales bacterium]
MIYNLGEKNSIFNQFIAEIRDENIQKDPMRFRINLERAGMIFAYEISKKLNYIIKEVQTPLGVAEVEVPTDKVVLGTILRAGLPLHNGMLSFFDHAENIFISAFRKYGKDNEFEIELEYIASPDLTDKVVVLSDPMLATGASMVLAYNALLEHGKPKHVHIVSLIAGKEGLDYCMKRLSNQSVTYWVGAVDDELTVKGYIVPGIGDAGDLAYGSKSSH